jgi:hypothetical protein
LFAGGGVFCGDEPLSSLKEQFNRKFFGSFFQKGPFFFFFGAAGQKAASWAGVAEKLESAMGAGGNLRWCLGNGG